MQILNQRSIFHLRRDTAQHTHKYKMPKDYDYLLKVLLVGDSDVGKHEIMAGLDDASSESPFCSRSGNCKYFGLILLFNGQNVPY